MRIRRGTTYAVIACAIGMGIVGIHTLSRNTEASDQAAQRRCTLEGSWITVPANADVINTVFAVPLDPGNERVSIIARIPQQDPTYGGAFPTVTRITDYVGEAVRTGLNTFSVTLVNHGINGNNLAFPQQVGLERVATAVLRGTIELIDCKTLHSEVWAAVYAPDQDPFGDEPPAYGCLGPFYNTRQRIIPGGEPCY